MITSHDRSRQRAVAAGFDDSDGSRHAVRWAAQEAHLRGCALYLVYALDLHLATFAYGWHPAAEFGDAEREETGRKAVEPIVAETRRDFPGLEVVPVFPTDEPVTAIAGVSTEVEADLTVVGSSGRGAIPRMLLGSTAAGLVHANGSPVVVVRGHRNGEPHTRGTVVAGVDGSETTRIVLGLAFEYASIHGFSVQTVHSSPRHRMDVRESEFSDRYLSECRSLFPQVPATMEVVDDKPAHALLERSGQASLVVVGSHRHGAVHRTLLGSVSHALLYHAECPVAVVPEPAGASV